MMIAGKFESLGNFAVNSTVLRVVRQLFKVSNAILLTLRINKLS